MDGSPFEIATNVVNGLAAARLCELGILKPAQFNITENDSSEVNVSVKYAVTSLGCAVAGVLTKRFMEGSP